MQQEKGFTLIETLVAITILTVAVAAPLTLAAQSLLAAYSARDQVVAFNLAQEAVEMIRAQRDGNLLRTVHGESGVFWLDGIPVQEDSEPIPEPFVIDSIAGTFVVCPSGDANQCPVLRFDSSTGFYGHTNGGNSRFTRYVTLTEVKRTGSTRAEEAKVRVIVKWRAGSLGLDRNVVLEENIYNWLGGAFTNP